MVEFKDMDALVKWGFGVIIENLMKGDIRSGVFCVCDVARRAVFTGKD